MRGELVTNSSMDEHLTPMICLGMGRGSSSQTLVARYSTRFRACDTNAHVTTQHQRNTATCPRLLTSACAFPETGVPASDLGPDHAVKVGTGAVTHPVANPPGNARPRQRRRGVRPVLVEVSQEGDMS